MTKQDLYQLSIRTGVVSNNETGYLLACDTTKEENEPHVKIIKWYKGNFSDSWANFNAHTICLVSKPNIALVFMSLSGNYGIHSKMSIADNIFIKSQPQPSENRYGDMRSVSEIGEKAYSVGHGGMVYRLDDFKKWTRIDEHLPRSFDVEAIHGFNASDINAVGFLGELWHFDGQKWTKNDLPTNKCLTTIKCTEDGMVFIAGHNGVLIRGKKYSWEVIDQNDITDDIWDLEWFDGELYASTMSNVYRLKDDSLELVDFGEDPPKTCHQLSATKDIMWSIGEKDIMSFDGNKWERIV